jgi:hypothetical protein
MRPDEVAPSPEEVGRFDQDPPRDVLLTSYLRHYEANESFALDDRFQAQLARVTAAAIERRYADRWYVTLGRFARVGIPMGLAAAAVAGVMVSRTPHPASAGVTPLMLSVATGAVPQSEFAALITVSANCQVDIMCGAFGRVDAR